MEELKRILTESYRKDKDGYVTLSGNCEGIDGIGKLQLEEFITKIKKRQKTKKASVGDVLDLKHELLKAADIIFQPIDASAKEMVRNELGREYVENKEGYIIDIDDVITVYADTERAKLYAVTVIMDSYEECMRKAVLYHYPASPHRSARVYLPPKKELPYFKKFIDLLVYLGYNTILLEIGGAMEYKRHPEINETWVDYCQSMKEFNNKTYVASKGYYRTKNSIHTYNGGGDIYTQEEMKEIVTYCAERYIEIIPEVPSLSHSEYFLLSHPELRECEDEPYASTACPSNEELYKLVFDLYDEVIDVFSPRTLHIGHDEWWVMCVCNKCKEKNAAVLFTENVLKCYSYLKERGIQTMMWADKMVRFEDKNGEVQGGGEKHVYHLKKNETIDVMGKRYPLYEAHWFKPTQEAVEKGFHQVIHDTTDCMHMLPDDIICLNWYWSVEPRVLDDYLIHGRNVIYGNFHMSGMRNYRERVAAGVQGFSLSNWLDSSEAGMQRWNILFDLGYSSAICWGHDRSEDDYEGNLKDTFEALYRYRNRDTLCGSHIEVVHTVEKTWENGERYYDELPYADEADMKLGEYVVHYEDGSCETFPVLYALNIGTKTASMERKISTRTWKYDIDKHLTTVASVCLAEKREDGVWYKTVFPTRSHVSSCEYIPQMGLEECVTVEEINIWR